MAKLPTAADMQRRAAPSATPGIRAPNIDYSPMAKASEALGAGIKSVGVAIQASGEAAEQEQAHELDRRMLDFKLATELDLEEQKRSMPEGGAGFTSNWLETYKDKARAFVGDKYGNIPQKYRAQIDSKLASHEVALNERAQRDEWAERDRKTVTDLGMTLRRTRSAVEASPDRLEEMWTEGKRLIDTSQLAPALKNKTARDYREQLEEASISSLIAGVRDTESYNRAKDALALNRPDRVTARRVAEAITSGKALDKAAGWAATNPTWRKLDGYTKAAIMSLMEADGADTQDAKNALGAMINRAGKAGEDLGAHVSRKIYQPTIEPAQEKRLERILNSPKVAELADWARRRAEGQEADPVNGATHFLAPERTMLALEAREPQKYKSWRSWTGYDAASGSYRGVITRDKSHAFLAPEGSAEDAGSPVETRDAYAGPYYSMGFSKRQAYGAKLDAQMDKVRQGVSSVIKKQMEVSADGNLPPEPILNELDRQVRAIGDPALAAQYDVMLRQAQLTQRLQRAPPQAIEDQARVLRDIAAREGETPEMKAQIEHVEKVGAAVRKNINDDPMTWANRTGIQVAVGNPSAGQGSFRAAQEVAMAPVRIEQINFGAPDIDTQLAYRMNQAKEVGRYYGQPPKAFTKAERDFLKDTLSNGGDGMLFVLGKIASAAGSAGIEPADVMKEFSKDAPEVAVIGSAVVNGADPRILDAAAKAISWRVKQGEKFVSTIDKAQVKPNLDQYADVLASTPTKVDAVRATANLVYEYEARRQGKETFNQSLYSTVVRRLMGETEMPDGSVFGGIGEQGRGWFDGKWSSGGFVGGTPKVMVPAEIKQDSFDDMVSAVRMKDFGDRPPLDDDGKPLSLTQIKSASWVSIGPGRYALELKRDADGTRVVARTPDRGTYILDVRGMLRAIQLRKPEIFRGYDGAKLKKDLGG